MIRIKNESGDKFYETLSSRDTVYNSELYDILDNSTVTSVVDILEENSAKSSPLYPLLHKIIEKDIEIIIIGFDVAGDINPHTVIFRKSDIDDYIVKIDSNSYGFVYGRIAAYDEDEEPTDDFIGDSGGIINDELRMFNYGILVPDGLSILLGLTDLNTVFPDWAGSSTFNTGTHTFTNNSGEELVRFELYDTDGTYEFSSTDPEKVRIIRSLSGQGIRGVVTDFNVDSMIRTF